MKWLYSQYDSQGGELSVKVAISASTEQTKTKDQSGSLLCS